MSEIDPTEFDTPLNPMEENLFKSWKAKYAPRDSGYDYDLRGAFKAGLTPGQNGHWDDTFKKPNHPTFSIYSKYAKDYPQLAGTWNGDVYVPPQQVINSAPQPQARNPIVQALLRMVAGK